MKSFIDEVQINEEPKENGQILKHIKLKFPVYFNGNEVWGIGWDNESTVETCFLLSRRNIGNKSTRIEIEIDLDEADRRECIGRATYQEIKNYILEHYQTKVSSLYISQVKRKCGLETRENFNKPKTDGNKVPNCPPEKEEMIKEAIRYFGMLNGE